MATSSENYVDITSNNVPGTGGAPGSGTSAAGGNSNNPVLSVNGEVPNQYGDLTLDVGGSVSELTDAEIITGTASEPSGTSTPAQLKLAAQTHGHGVVKNEAASRALVLSDDQALLVVNNASTTSFTIPNDATVAWTSGAFVAICQEGAGAPAFVAGAGVTLLNPNGLLLVNPGQFLAVQRIGANKWAVV